MFSKIRNQSGLGVLELTILLCGIIATLGGSYLGYTKDGSAVPGQHLKMDEASVSKTQDVIIIDLSGQQHGVKLEQGKSYNVQVTPDGNLMIEEKK